MNKFKGFVAAFLAVSMVFSMMPARAVSEEDDAQQLAAEEIEGISRLDAEKPSQEEESLTLYADDEIVTVIVQLEDAPLMEYFNISTYSQNDEEMSSGEAVSEFLSSDDATILSEELLDQQQVVVDEISELTENTPEVVGQWTSLINAVAIKVPYAHLKEIQAMKGIKRAYVEHIYSRPDEPVTEAGEIAGYSYDMVGIQEVWNAGYTGKGLLIAVLDTGLDLNWQAYADPHIVTVHEAFTDNSFNSEDAKDYLRYNSTSLAAFLKENTLNAEFRGGDVELTYDYNALYKNLKVPFAYDYADLDLNVQPLDSDHGTHVAGTVAGYAETAEGEVEFSGTAPDAQILAMKVFPDEDGGALEGDIIAALEDALKLGADVINLSLGSDNGFAEDDSAANEAYDLICEAGIVVMSSAGNAAYSSDNSNYGSYGLASDPDISMVGSPSTYNSQLSVASINNTVKVETVFSWLDADGMEHEVVYLDPTDVAMKYKFAGQDAVSIVPVSGSGTWQDYYDAGFRNYYGYGEEGKTGIALVQRGDLYFSDKINNASSFAWTVWEYNAELGQTAPRTGGVLAVIIYDNVDGDLIYMSVGDTSLTSAFISKADGEAIVEAVNAGYDVQITVREQDRLSSWEEGSQMSDFSSWGATPGLELKPEITAPGGNIWSSITGGASADGSSGSYGMMSGTSMAAPHMSGIAALVKQYVLEKQLPGKKEDADLTNLLLMSTARPQTDENGVYYSPRQQGAGLVDAAAAIKTPAYISVDDQKVGKLELKDDPNKNGSYTFSFNINNMTTDILNYNVKAILLRPDTIQSDSYWGERTLMIDSDVLIKEVDLGTVTVPASSNGIASTAFSKTVTLTSEEKEEIDTLFENGTYVEGFIILTDADGDNPQIGLPFLSFYGDWTAAPIFDHATWIDEVNEDETYIDNEATWWTSMLGYFDGYSFYNLGQNPFDSTAADTQTAYYEENITISPNGIFRSINDYELYQLRDAKVMVVEVKDKETGELYYRDYATYQYKTYYDSENAWPIPSSMYYFTGSDWEGTDLDGNVLPSGTQCVYTITAYGDGDYPIYYDEEAGYWITDIESVIPGVNEPTFNGHKMDMNGDVLSFDVMVDNEAPKLINNAVTIYEKDGRTYITGTFTDEGSIASVEIRPLVKRSYKEGYGDPDYFEYGLDESNPFYCEYIYDADTSTWNFTADVTEYAHTNEAYDGENYYYDFEWSGNVYVYGGDYGGNDRAYAISVNADPGLVLSQTSAILYVGSEFDLSVNNNTGSDAALTRSSSNPEVASVDEYGHIVALAPGQTTITVSNGTETAVCIVAVRERTSEVLDFDLSIENFSGLTPTGEIVVKVTNLQPADVELNEIRWEVSEDDETAENYEGLITCEKYTSDGLSGLIYLNYSTYDPYNMGYPLIPGGSGTLKVTLNGVTRTMNIDWEDLYKTSSDEDLISDLYGNAQTVYVNEGETATLIAKYNNDTAHSTLPVKLYTAQNSENYSYSNPTEESIGLVLDGAPTVGVGSYWSGKIVNLEGYALPENIMIGVHYDYGYEYLWQNTDYMNYYTYDPSTGEIVVFNAPYGATNTLVIRADGVESEGKPAGELSGIEYEVPEPLYGPFNWAPTEGKELTGELTTAEKVLVDGYTEKNVAYYTPSEAGVSNITATTKDGKYSVNFTVICEPVLAESIDLDTHNLEMVTGDTNKLTASLTPDPVLEENKSLKWISYNPEVATVDENGVVTALSAGYAFIGVSTTHSEYGQLVETYCIVHVLSNTYTVTFVDYEGTVLSEQMVNEGEAAVAPDVPVREGFTFTGWDKDFNEVSEDMTITAQYDINTYTVTFIANDQTVHTITVEHGQILTDADYPAVPEKEGYKGEWTKYTEGVTEDITIKAEYTAISTQPEDPTKPENPNNSANTNDTVNIGSWIGFMLLSAALLFVISKKETLFAKDKD